VDNYVDSWVDALAAAGVEVASADRCHVQLRHAGVSRSFSLRRRSRSPRPSELEPACSPDALLIAPRLSASSQARLLDLGWSWVTETGQLHLQFADHVIDARAGTAEPTTRSPAAAPLPTRGTGTFAVLRRLLLGRPARQVELASAAGVTQPRVSQILATLAKDGLVTRESAGWRVTDRDDTLQAWLAQYPGPGGVTTYWTGLDDAWSQALAVLSVLPPDAVVSGDLGADLLAPWRQPRHATIYTPTLHELARTGLVQVGAHAEGTVTVCAPADRSVWPAEAISRRFRDQAISVADPLQVLWDVRAAADEDSAQAADHLMRWLRQQYPDEVESG
jgi:hypothetical protein